MFIDALLIAAYLCRVRSLKEGEDQKEITIEAAQALDEMEPLPEDCYTRPISLPEGLFTTQPRILTIFCLSGNGWS